MHDYDDCIDVVQTLSDAAERFAELTELMVDIARELERRALRKRKRFGFARHTRKESYYKRQWIPVARMHRVQDRS